MERFLSLSSEQSNEREQGESTTSTTNQVKILKFEDTLTDMRITDNLKSYMNPYS